MFRIFFFCLSIIATQGFAQELEQEMLPSILLERVCPEGQIAYPAANLANAVCGPQERFGCPSDWVMVTRDGALESCTQTQPEAMINELIIPELKEICPAGEAVYYRLDGPHCAPVNSDVGQACSTALDCEGTCFGSVEGQGVCSAGPPNVGCTDFLGPDGRVESICIE